MSAASSPTPQFASLEAFLAMGGHAPYVWGAWGLSALVIILVVVAVASSQRHWKRRLEQLEQLSGQRRDNRP
jgi:heme exporter protein D